MQNQSANDDNGELVRKLSLKLDPDPSRTVIRPFLPSDPEPFAVAGKPRAARIAARVLALDDAVLQAELARARESLDHRHRDVDALLLRRFDQIACHMPPGVEVDEARRLLVGAYLSAEYSFEAAALFNPSMVAAPDQGDAASGDTRFIMSLRGIGEGHMSSVAFRIGVWRADGEIALDPASEIAMPPIVVGEAGANDDEAITLDCSGARDPSETVLFPLVESQSRGIEDLRLTRFVRDDGSATYLGTYTAVGAGAIRQEILQTDDFRSFHMRPVRGDLAPAKGLALFPRLVGGRHLAIGRQDNENLWLAHSDDMITWDGGTKLMEPTAPWEIIQLGNCGSPIEIEEGWLLLTHGVGVVRNYCIGAALLDRDDPSRVIGRLREPLLAPGDDDRDGYVPNVVYSCGGMVRGRTLLLPYAVADEFTRFATVSLDRLVAAMR